MDELYIRQTIISPRGKLRAEIEPLKNSDRFVLYISNGDELPVLSIHLSMEEAIRMAEKIWVFFGNEEYLVEDDEENEPED